MKKTASERDPREYTPEEPRRARVVPVYAALRTLDTEGLADLVDRCYHHARRFFEGLTEADHDTRTHQRSRANTIAKPAHFSKPGDSVMRLILTTVFLASILVASTAAIAKIQADKAAPSVRLTGEKVTIPLVLIKGYPFVEGEVNGVKGKFMFDIGADAALSLNDHYVPLKGGTVIGGNKVGSGQIFASKMHKTIASVKFAQFSYTDVHHVESSDAAQIQKHITPDFLGWIGFEFFHGYAIKIDYQKDKVTFYKAGPAAVTHFLSGETVVAVIPFLRPKLARIPVVAVTIGKTRFDGSFDTGDYGEVWIDKATRRKLAAEGILSKADDSGDGRVNISGIDIGNGAANLTLRSNVLPPPMSFAEATNQRPSNDVTFGYNLISKYKTVFDYPNHKIYLLEYERN